ncbi:glycolate oxidase subunit GlcE [Aureimonas fodinaquatilis]|uniref:Glycolate oxidase subunit GlcE n=1 Tax=Aureimonas fodinaquatilis TaxID=2565783 RepID=A0A5B0E367_9HYPH|nr:glycolate oxidase subunit GlcE [Aureimonas fodinaquatilis]KAA0971869.1 glycolate oxidase subunit GlcE [Aureimonas fodinaquatilis]
MQSLQHQPQTAEDVRDIVLDAVAQATPLAIEGTGTKHFLGKPVQAAATLSTAGLSGVTLYEPEELVLSARAGTPMAEIEAVLKARGQRLEFEPLDYGPLLGQPAGQGTLGGVMSCNLSGPRRIKQGAARDHILGVGAVSGRGEIYKAGGRVVKNVTGFDLSKGLTGAYGTLSVLTDITIKVMPDSQSETTLLLRDMQDDEAMGALSAAMGSPGEVSAAAHLPYGVAGRVLDGALGKNAATLMRLEGFGPSVKARAAHLGAALEKVGRVERLEDDESRALWRDVRDVTPFAGPDHRVVWRLSVTPTRAADVVMALRMHIAADALYDWQGGLVFLRLEHGVEAERIRAVIAAHGGGHATLLRASMDERLTNPVFQPQPAALAALSQRLKQQFDPVGILNPGRMG